MERKMKKNCYGYTKTELRKLKREELLMVYYEQTKDYYESVNGCDKEWSKNHTFEDFVKNNIIETKEDILEKCVYL